MIKTVDLNRDLEGLARLEGRGAHTTEEEAQASFMTLADFRDGGIFAAHFSGSSGWERHPKGDELVQILDGATRFDVITGEGMNRWSCPPACCWWCPGAAGTASSRSTG